MLLTVLMVHFVLAYFMWLSAYQVLQALLSTLWHVQSCLVGWRIYLHNMF